MVWNLFLSMVWVWKLPISFLVRVKLRRALRILYMCFGKGLAASLNQENFPIFNHTQ